MEPVTLDHLIGDQAEGVQVGHIGGVVLGNLSTVKTLTTGMLRAAHQLMS